MEQMTFNEDVFAAFEDLLPWDSVTESLREAIHYGLMRHSDGGWINSYELADLVCKYNQDADPKQQRDYLQHLLREATHVCRYADQHHYRAHVAEQCSDSCTTHD